MSPNEVKFGLIPLVIGIILTVGCILSFIVVIISPPIGWELLDFIILLIMLIIGVILIIGGIIILFKDPDWYIELPETPLLTTFIQLFSFLYKKIFKFLQHQF